MTPYARAVASLSRRELLNAAWKLGALAVAQPLTASRLSAQAAFSSNPFTLGVASGDPLPDGVVLWTRLAPEPLQRGGGMPRSRVDVAWEVSPDDTFRRILTSGIAAARPELGHSVHVEVSGLQPGRDYWYRFTAGGAASETGRTRTAPAAAAAVDRLRFGVCGCSHYEQGYFTAYRRIAEEAFDFVFHTGDYIYETKAEDGGGRVRRHASEELFSLDDYRLRYAQYKVDADLRAAHAASAFVLTHDDHEVVNDYAGDAAPNDTPSEVFLLRRAAAFQAYYEMLPLRRASLPEGPGARFYRRLAFGQLLDLHALDTRQYRSDQPCGGGLKALCAEATQPGRTMLGAAQERWLFDNLRSAGARWTVLGQQVPTFRLDRAAVNRNERFAMDKWDGYTAARDRVYRRLVDSRVPNPVVLSGDVHVHQAADLKLDYDNPRSRTVGVELTNTSITSGLDGSDVSQTWEKSRSLNPHIAYYSNRRGYIACTATPASLTADFKVLDRVTVAGAPATLGASFVVQAGRPGLTPR